MRDVWAGVCLWGWAIWVKVRVTQLTVKINCGARKTHKSRLRQMWFWMHSEYEIDDDGGSEKMWRDFIHSQLPLPPIYIVPTQYIANRGTINVSNFHELRTYIYFLVVRQRHDTVDLSIWLQISRVKFFYHKCI